LGNLGRGEGGGGAGKGGDKGKLHHFEVCVVVLFRIVIL
jgi:hypothetical protein